MANYFDIQNHILIMNNTLDLQLVFLIKNKKTKRCLAQFAEMGSSLYNVSRRALGLVCQVVCPECFLLPALDLKGMR